MLEKEIQARLVAKLHSDGWFVTKINLASVAGFPDLFVAKAGKIALIECKKEGLRPRKLQEICHKKLREQNVNVVVYDGTKDITELL